MAKRKNDFIINIPLIEIIDKRTFSKVKFKKVNFDILKDLDLKFNWGIFVPKDEKKKNGEEIKK